MVPGVAPGSTSGVTQYPLRRYQEEQQEYKARSEQLLKAAQEQVCAERGGVGGRASAGAMFMCAHVRVCREVC